MQHPVYGPCTQEAVDNLAMHGAYMELLGYSKVVKQHTELEHTPVGNLYQQATSWESGFIVGELVRLPKG